MQFWNLPFLTESLGKRCVSACIVAVLALPAPVAAQPFDVPKVRSPSEIIGPCLSGISPVAGLTPMPPVTRALDRGNLTILAIGSSSTSGVGASSAQATYPARLGTRLRRIFPRLKVRVINRGIPGETLVGAAGRLKFEVEKSRPDLVLWQLGTNGALNRIGIEKLRDTVTKSLLWLRDRDIAVLLIDPQYVKRFERLEHYSRVVEELARLADEQRVGLIRRYDSMRAISERQHLSAHLASDRFHLNDLGYRCLANYAAYAIFRSSPGIADRRAD